MNERTKFINWSTLLILVIVYVIGFVGFLLVGAVIAQAMPVLGGSMMFVGFGSLACAFQSLRLMEHYA